MQRLKIIISIFSFLFGGCLASFLISLYFYKASVKKEFNKQIKILIENSDERLLKILTKINEKMNNSELDISLIQDKDSYTFSELQEIVNKKVDETIMRRNIQLQQFIEDAIAEQD